MRAPELVLLQRDATLAEVLAEVLADEGLAARVAAHDEELASCALCIADLDLASLRAVVARAGAAKILSLEAVPDDLARAGVFALRKPFELDALLAAVARALGLQADEPSAAVVRSYFGSLGARRWDEVAALCADDVVYHLRNETTIVGRAAFRGYTERVFAGFPDASFEGVRVHALPRSLVASFVGRFTAANGDPVEMPGAVRFRLEGSFIQEIGVDTDTDRLRALGHSL